MCTMLGQRRRRWAYVVQMLYKCFVFAGELQHYGNIGTMLSQTYVNVLHLLVSHLLVERESSFA